MSQFWAVSLDTLKVKTLAQRPDTLRVNFKLLPILGCMCSAGEHTYLFVFHQENYMSLKKPTSKSRS